MRLIHVETLRIEVFNEPPHKYAILSHRWIHGQEVCLQDWEAFVAKQQPILNQIQPKLGFIKIHNACAQAKKQGMDWIWIDTMCIDKTNDAEVKMSINRMFSWYQQASICLVYLHDLQGGNRLEVISEDQKPTWFTRGWTLQELLAPTTVLFFDQHWNYLGTRSELAEAINKFTGIPLDVLCHCNIKSYSYAKRLSWSKGRETELPEDRVYSLIGLSEVFVSAEYGIGYHQALLKLKSAILERRREGHFPASDKEYLSKVIEDLETHNTGKLNSEKQKLKT
jgi:hypothetical protein